MHYKHNSTPLNHEFREASWPAGHSSPTPYGSPKPATHEIVVEIADLWWFEGFLVMKILISGLSCKIKTPKIRRRHLFLGAGDFVLRAQRLHRWLRHQRDQALSHSRRSSTGREEGPRLRTWNQKISSNMIWYYTYIYTYIMYIYILCCVYIYIYCVYIYIVYIYILYH